MQPFAYFNDILSGSTLKSLFKTSAFTSLLNRQKIPFDASIALLKIKDYYGVEPDTYGDNILGISNIRDALFDLKISKSIINGLTITAPHTHWKKVKPVIYSFDKASNSYTIGHQPIKTSKLYKPVSYLFHDNYLLPYEWIDDSVHIHNDEWQDCIDAIKKLNHNFENKDIPLGIAIDFRFRASLLDEAAASLELPLSRNVDTDYSYIINKSEFVHRSENEVVEQVSWHAMSQKFYNLSTQEKEVESEIRIHLSSLQDDDEKERFLIEIETILEHSENRKNL